MERARLLQFSARREEVVGEENRADKWFPYVSRWREKKGGWDAGGLAGWACRPKMRGGEIGFPFF